MTISTPSSAVQPASRTAHRVWIAGGISTLLGFYYQDTAPRLSEAAGKAWADDLEHFPREVIAAALDHWRRTETYRPTPAHIIRLCQQAMPRPTVVPISDEPQRVRVTAERGLEMMEEVGLISAGEAELWRARHEAYRESLSLGVAAAALLQRTAEARRMPTARE